MVAGSLRDPNPTTTASSKRRLPRGSCASPPGLGAQSIETPSPIRTWQHGGATRFHGSSSSRVVSDLGKRTRLAPLALIACVDGRGGDAVGRLTASLHPPTAKKGTALSTGTAMSTTPTPRRSRARQATPAAHAGDHQRHRDGQARWPPRATVVAPAATPGSDRPAGGSASRRPAPGRTRRCHRSQPIHPERPRRYRPSFSALVFRAPRGAAPSLLGAYEPRGRTAPTGRRGRLRARRRRGSGRPDSSHPGLGAGTGLRFGWRFHPGACRPWLR